MIESFGAKTEYRWLSNFTEFETPMEYQGMSFKTVEHFYVAMKVTDVPSRKEVSQMDTAGQVKLFGRKLQLRDDWEDIKDEVMLYATRYKYSKANPVLRQKLIDTGACHIQEGNYWGDKYWGVCLKKGGGINKLGEILMKVRGEII